MSLRLKLAQIQGFNNENSLSSQNTINEESQEEINQTILRVKNKNIDVVQLKENKKLSITDIFKSKKKHERNDSSIKSGIGFKFENSIHAFVHPHIEKNKNGNHNFNDVDNLVKVFSNFSFDVLRSILKF